MSARLDELRAAARAGTEQAQAQAIDKALDLLRDQGIETRVLGPGDAAPEFSLPNLDGSRVSSVELLKQGPLVVSFQRGAWCPFCNVEVEELQMHLPEFRELDASLVAVSPERPERARVLKDRFGIEFPMLYDRSNSVAKSFGLVFEVPAPLKEYLLGQGVDLAEFNDDDSWTLPMPGSFVIDPSGRILYGRALIDYTRRVPIEELTAVLRKRKWNT